MEHPEAREPDHPPRDGEPSGAPSSSARLGPFRLGKRLLARPAVQGFSKLAGGAAMAQLIVLAAAPILTRLYSPEDFGVLAMYLAICGLVTVIAAGRYELAIVLPKDDLEAIRLAAIALLLVLVTSLISLLAAIVAYAFVVRPNQWPMGAWVLLIPFTVLGGGASAVFVAAATRRGDFGMIATRTVMRQVVGATAQIALGLLQFSPGGLMVGAFLGVGASNVRLARPVLQGIRSDVPTLRQLRATARSHARFPRYTLPAGLINNLYSQGTPLLIGGIFGAATLGVWSLAQRVVSLPSTVVGEAAATSYYRSASNVRTNPPVALSLFDRTVVGLAAISLVPFVALGLWGPQLFSLVFGPEWEAAGDYARLLIPVLWAQFVASPISTTFLVYGKNRLGLRVQGALLSVLLGAAAVAVQVNLEFSEFLLIFSVSSALVYLVLLQVARSVIRSSTTEGVPSVDGTVDE